MKISYRTHPVLQFLRDKSILDCKVFVDQTNKDVTRQMFENWQGLANVFSDNICFISESFYRAYAENRSKLNEQVRLFYKEEFSHCSKYGTFLMPGGKSVCYLLYNMPDDLDLNDKNTIDDFGAVIFTFDRELICEWYCVGKKNGLFYENFYNGTKRSDIESGLPLLADIVVFTCFMKYCNIEDRFIEAKQRSKGISCKYINESDFKIKHIDSLWFTNLHVSGAFKVRGHLRLQPKKEKWPVD